jgi:hypothetical protein
MPSGEAISDELISKVGKAAGHITAIKRAYKVGVQAAKPSGERQQLSQRVEQEAVRVINDEGITVEQYNDVITAAEDDPDLEQRLLTAAAQEG